MIRSRQMQLVECQHSEYVQMCRMHHVVTGEVYLTIQQAKPYKTKEHEPSELI